MKNFAIIAAFAFSLVLVPSAARATEPPLIIKAVNPGYTVNGQANTGELIELQNLSSSSLSLAGFSLYYTNSSGNRSNLIEFPEGSRISGEASLLLRLASSPDMANADLLYTKTLAMAAGPLELVYLDQKIDSVCWDGSEACLAKFSKNNPTTIVRETSTNTYTHQTGYEPDWTPARSAYSAPPANTTDASESAAAEAAPSKCKGLQFTELLSYYDEAKSEQFIELFNGTDESMELTGCTILYKKKFYPLIGTLGSGDYLIRDTNDFTLTKNPTSTNILTLIDANGDELDTLTYPHGQKKSASYALMGYDVSGQPIWQITYHPTPGAANIYQEFRSCPAGKVINEATGNCVKAATLEPIKDCPVGKYRNPATGRCKSAETSSGLTPCKAGYERNPETNRCRKIKSNTGADFALVPETGGENQSFIAIWALAALAGIGFAYLIFQYRRELKTIARKLFRRLKTPPRN